MKSRYLFLGVLFVASGCVNSSLRQIKSRTASDTGPTHAIRSATQTSGEVSVVIEGRGTTTAPLTSFCSGYSQTPEDAARPCTCSMSWTSGTVTEVATWNVHTSAASVEGNGNGTLTCAPSAASNQATLPVPGAAQITLQLAATGSATPFRVSPAIFNGSATSTVDMVDSSGRGLNVIHRYSCFETSKAIPVVRNRVQHFPASSPSPAPTLRAYEASRFCASDPLDPSSSSTVDGCSDWGTISQVDSSQSYYYNLYRKRRDLGGGRDPDHNDRYSCPRVDRNFHGGQGLYPLDATFALWDRQSVNPSESVPVIGASTLGQPGVAGTASANCTATAIADGHSDELAYQCLGWAKKPNSDGSCGSIEVNVTQGSTIVTRTQPTYRLRRFTALYPPQLTATSRVVSQVQALDTVYVLDRPVYQTGPSGSPGIPYATMRGPLPCIFAQLDYSGIADPYASEVNRGLHAGIVAPDPVGRVRAAWYLNEHLGVPHYYGTNSSYLEGINIDGRVLPYRDTIGYGFGTNGFGTDDLHASCSAALPIVSWDFANNTPARNYLRTTNDAARSPIELGGERNYMASTRIPMGWSDAWTPVYDEDTSFEACAPPPMDSSGNVVTVDPPMHTMVVGAKLPDPTVGASLATWCAEAYPTQNENISDLEALSNPLNPGGLKTGLAKNFTSHVVKHNVTGTAAPGIGSCAPTIMSLPTNYPPAGVGSTYWHYLGVARHDAGHIIDNEGRVNGVGGYPANLTCDRTVMGRPSTGTGQIWNFPLLAPPEDVEQSLREFPGNFGCIYTSGPYKGKASPSGCCELTSTSGAGHFEPSSTGTTCGIPIVPASP